VSATRWLVSLAGAALILAVNLYFRGRRK